ncbi:hypothetical protein GTW51_14120 [Aurantimonas aggregata]|uniref:Sulfotransferase family protein n=1 Tax=Aurantimonas aggregata TaxID=2047720 RepID=A0A6L9MJ27_9HYPH|nr:hypothetical protein [Aurantimonas aggregata]NDV87839.1 hypothetical protein [Aurantimonas aggregata]
MSASRFFQDSFPSEEQCPHKLWDDLVRTEPDPRWRVYYGHCGGLLPVWLRSWPTTVSLLRDPTARTISLIKHVLRAKIHPLHQLAQGRTVAEYCLHPVLSRSVQNTQARFLSSLALSRQLVAQDSTAHAAVQFAFSNSLYALDSPAALLETALTSMDALAAVGVAEKHDMSLTLFARVIGLPEPTASIRENVAPQWQPALDVTADDYAAVQSVTEIDRILYERGLERFTQQCREYGVAEHVHPD